MGKALRAQEDKMKHDGPHCHAPIHPAAPVPTPVPHSCAEHLIIKGAATVKINNKPAVRVTDTSIPCDAEKGGCPPGGPGMLAKGSATVKIEMLPAGRKDDIVLFAACIGPIPMPKGTASGPGSDDVDIGG
jgi:uncharacterized Zn-binding protein involved in type VI secretion